MSASGAATGPGLRWATRAGTVTIKYDASPGAQAVDASASLEQALAWHRAGQFNRAEAVYRAVLREQPEHPEALHLLGMLAHQRGDPREAVRLIKQALALNPDAAVYHNDCAQAHCALGAFETAEKYAQRAIAIAPDYIQAYNNLGIALASLGRFEEALERYRQGLRIDPYNADINCNIANALANLGDVDGAATHYEHAVRADPRHVNAHLQLALTRPESSRVPALETLSQDTSVAPTERAMCDFAIGHILAAGKDYDEAFAHYTSANERVRNTLHYNDKVQTELVSAIIETFDTPASVSPHDDAPRDAKPILIVGMPRSGTTLVEQIISSHADVHGAGELPYLPMIERAMVAAHGRAAPYPQVLGQLRSNRLAEGAAEYLRQLAALAPQVTHVTDKMPMNFMRLGLVARMLPGARVVHCRRDARDTCVSNYATFFSDPLANRFAFDLYELGRFHRDYARLMSHWQDLLGPRIIEVEYESLVADQEATSRGLIEALGLPWDARCLDFVSNARAVKTASIHQVRQPLYGASIGRWRRYEKHLKPLMEGLGLADSASDSDVD